MLKNYLAERIRKDGPLSFSEYMREVLYHPLYGYYMSGVPLHRDFITSPEISQMFGEILGLWGVSVWQDMGVPKDISVVELGPGTGVMMKDMCRIFDAASMPYTAYLLEVSPILKHKQKQMLGDKVTWIESLDQLPPRPTLWLSNEFFDAFPIEIYKRIDGRWKKKAFVNEKLLEGYIQGEPSYSPDTSIDVYEESLMAENFFKDVCTHMKQHMGAFLAIDYGYDSLPGYSTISLTRQHKRDNLFSHQGDQDITAKVNFSALMHIATSMKCTVLPLTTQKSFLESFGISIRAQKLIQKNPEKSREILCDLRRLCHEMGTLFKVFCVLHSKYS